MQEIWKDIKDYEGIYQISNYGNVKSFEKKISISISHGYPSVVLYKNGKQKSARIHRLVAEAFLKKTNFKSLDNEDRYKIDINSLEVNHKDEDKSNNFVENLEWCTRKYNMSFGTLRKRMGKSHRKSVNQYDLSGNLIKCFSCIKIASIESGADVSAITRCCKNKQKTSNGFMWKYADII